MPERAAGLNVLVRLFWIVFALLFFIFALLAVDQEVVALRLLSWQSPELSVFWWLLLAFSLGVVLSSIGFSLMTLRLRWRHRRQLAGKEAGRNR